MSEAAWQLGYPLELLSEVASLFAQHDEPYALGAFARVKEAHVQPFRDRLAALQRASELDAEVDDALARAMRAALEAE